MATNYILLEKITVGAAGASSVTFSSIPQTGYTDLLIKVSARSSTNNTYDDLQAKFNGVSLSYENKNLSGPGNGIAVGSGSNAYTTSGYCGTIPALTATANTFGNGEISIPNYTSANKKPFSCDFADERNVSTGVWSSLNANLWSNTAAITTIQLIAAAGDLVQHSTFSLYGVAALGTTPVIVPYATGGDTIMTDGTYWYHAFKASGTFTPAKTLSCDHLVVAGGGGGGYNFSGGAGAGGYRSATSQTFNNGTAYTMTIGAGGTGSTGGTPTSGGTSSIAGTAFTTFASSGGGYGQANASAGITGGSGSGAGSSNTGAGGAGNSGSYSPVEGYAGGSGVNTGVPRATGGGGGAGAVGGNASGITNGVGGIGGAGSNAHSTWASATSTGASGYYAGGGGGTGESLSSAGGAGGGGASGAASGTGVAGTANTGGGGGGGGNGNGNGGNGGSGIVIVRYAV